MPKDRDRKRKSDRDPKGRSKSRGSKKSKAGKKPLAYLEPLTRKQARKEVKAATKLEFGPVTSQIKSEKRASKKREGQIADWFGGYGQTVEGAKASTDAKYQQTLAQIAAQTAGTSAQEEIQRANLAAEERADAERRGATYDPKESEAASQASLARRSTADTNYSTVAGQGASQYAYLTDKGRIGEGEKVQQMLDEAARGRTFDSDLRELRREKGAYRTAEKGRLRTEDREYLLQQQALRGEKAGRRSQMKLAKQYGKNTKREQNRSLRNQLAVTGAQSAAEKRDDARSRDYLKAQGKQSGGGGGERVKKKDLRRAMAYLRNTPGKVDSRKGAIDYLINRGVDPRVARKADRKAARQGKRQRQKAVPGFSGFH